MPRRSDRQRAQVLRPRAAAERIDVGQVAPPEDLAWLVDYLWWVRWDCPVPYEQEVIPRPVVHMAVEPDAGRWRVRVHGVHRRLFRTRLEDRGLAVAVAFRPGGFRPLLGADVASLRDRVVPLGDLFDVDDRALAAAVRAVDDPDAAAALLVQQLRGLAPAPDPRVAEVAGLVERVEHDTALTRAEQLAEVAGVGLRTLQRRFLAYVGVGPKWVVQRFRLLDVADAAHRGEEVDWADLAVRLGYADQSHLIRTFAQLVGHPPASYSHHA